jgi:hypothetical protein
MDVKTEILFNPFPKQIEFLEAVFSGKYSIIMYGGSIRGGKTAGGIGAALLLCKKYPLSRWAIVRDSLPTLKRTTIPSFFKFCPTRFIRSYNQEQQLVTFTNGSQIIFFPENYDDDKELNRWRGLEVSGFLLEEVNEINEKSFYKAIERAGSHVIPNKPKPLIMCTCNPASNWVKDKFYDPWKSGALPDKWHYISSKIFDNPFVTADQDYMESLKTMPRYEYDVFVNGNWDIQKRTGAEFYKEFNLDCHVKELKYNPDLPIWISIDENVNPYFPATLWQIDGKEARCFDEIAMRNPNNTVTALGKEIRMRYGEHKSGFIIGGDATSKKEDVKQEKGHNLFRLLQNEIQDLHPDIKVLSSNPAVMVRQFFMNKIFFNQMRGEPYLGITIFIDPKCKITVQDYQNVKEDSRNGKNGKYKEMAIDADSGISSQKYGHMSDTGDYLMCYAFREEYAFHQNGGNGFTPIIGTPKNGGRRW